MRSPRPQTILVTGGAGFIGSHIARRLLAEGHRVFIVDDLITGLEANLPQGATWLRGDIGKADVIARLPAERFDAVLHLAAQSSGEISHDRPELDLSTNALGTLNLLNWCEKRGVPRFLHASSMSVYGDPDLLPVDEEQRCHPLSYYGITKLAGEGYVRAFQRRGLKTTMFRMFSVYGPGQNLDNLKQGIVSIYMAYILKNHPIPVQGSLDRFRDLVYIDDVVEAWVRALEKPEAEGKIFNVASGKKTTVAELIREEAKLAGHANGNYPIEAAPPTPGDQFGMLADIGLIRRELDWEPRTSLPEGLATMWNWAKKERNGK